MSFGCPSAIKGSTKSKKDGEPERERILILGAAGRDFHDFNVFFRSKPQYVVVGFTAAQIPAIACRLYPPELSGELYPDGLPIWPEDSLEEIIRAYSVDRCILAYSDLSHQTVMDMASRILATGSGLWFSWWLANNARVKETGSSSLRSKDRRRQEPNCQVCRR